MFRILILLLSLSLNTSALYNFKLRSAASPSQIRFALENKYDDTGPGASKPEFAYNTYKHLQDAIIGYLDDPDTKLPQAEKNKAVKQLISKTSEGFQRYYPKSVEEYTGYMVTPSPVPVLVQAPVSIKKPPLQSPIVLTKLPSKKYHQGSKDLGGELAEAYRLHKLSVIRANPLSLAHYTRDSDIQPFGYSYGVHSIETGDSKLAKEVRDADGSVRGLYSFVDSDGKLRTVRYTADDQRGFIANVERS